MGGEVPDRDTRKPLLNVGGSIKLTMNSVSEEVFCLAPRAAICVIANKCNVCPRSSEDKVTAIAWQLRSRRRRMRNRARLFM